MGCVSATWIVSRERTHVSELQRAGMVGLELCNAGVSWRVLERSARCVDMLLGNLWSSLRWLV